MKDGEEVEVSTVSSSDRPRLLIEDWLPIAEMGVESRRERGASSALPPLYFLHVWWARRPLISARGTVLASLLPAWSEDWPVELQALFENEKDYRQWFLHLIGIRGDPVEREKELLHARSQGRRLDYSYDGPRAFTLSPEPQDFEILQELYSFVWGTEKPAVLDPTAGGGPSPWSHSSLVINL